MSKKFFSLQFTLLILISLVFIGLCLLGRWQLARGFEKKTLIQAQNQASQEPKLNTSDLLSHPIEALRYRPISLKAHPRLQHAFLLDNQMYQGRIGYHVLIPLEINKNKFIFLNVGWVPASISRNELPNIADLLVGKFNPAPINHQITIEGYVEKGYVNPLITKTLESEILGWPLRIQHMDYTLFGQILGGEVLPGIIILEEPKIPDVFPLPKSQTWLTPEKHFGYAFQWFSLAAALFVMTLLSVRKLRKP
tara:strand:+ start:19217 stop:19969 length:753 start_codon:yes stop_codon:yes gene_type:complete